MFSSINNNSPFPQYYFPSSSSSSSSYPPPPFPPPPLPLPLPTQQQEPNSSSNTVDTNNNNNLFYSQNHHFHDQIPLSTHPFFVSNTTINNNNNNITPQILIPAETFINLGVSNSPPNAMVPASSNKVHQEKLGKNGTKKDRHSKIYTAQGLRDRRVRLSIEIAREFFDLHDMLGFDKASKTLEWLLIKSKKAIKEESLARSTPSSYCNNISLSSTTTTTTTTSECEEAEVNEAVVDPSSHDPHEENLLVCTKNFDVEKLMLSNSKESRAMARARARARTKEKRSPNLILKKGPSLGVDDHHHQSSSAVIKWSKLKLFSGGSTLHHHQPMDNNDSTTTRTSSTTYDHDHHHQQQHSSSCGMMSSFKNQDHETNSSNNNNDIHVYSPMITLLPQNWDINGTATTTNNVSGRPVGFRLPIT